MAAEQHPPGEYARPMVSVDLVIFTVVASDLKVLLIQRGEEPFKGRWALPGGFVRVGPTATDQGEDLEAAAARELHEETGLRPGSVYLEQFRTYGRAGRDPRARVITVAWCALVRSDLAGFVAAGGDAAVARWFSLTEAPLGSLAFDHAQILAEGLDWIRKRLDDSDVALELVPDPFTIAELRSVYEVITGQPLDPGNFRRRFGRLLESQVVEVAPGRRVTTARPAQVYRFARRRQETPHVV